jgi:succinyl-CoA synthetase beta subunit
MKIHEYRAKALLREFAVPVPNGDVADTPAKAREIAQRLGVRIVVKAQVHAGCRGKAGGIKVADDPSGAEAAAKAILGMHLKTPEPPEGLVRNVWVEARRSTASSISR